MHLEWSPIWVVQFKEAKRGNFLYCYRCNHVSTVLYNDTLLMNLLMVLSNFVELQLSPKSVNTVRKIMLLTARAGVYSLALKAIGQFQRAKQVTRKKKGIFIPANWSLDIQKHLVGSLWIIQLLSIHFRTLGLVKAIMIKWGLGPFYAESFQCCKYW